MKNFYVKYNADTQKIIAGPQQLKPADDWVKYEGPLSVVGKEITYFFDESANTLRAWVIGDKTPAYNVRRARLYPTVQDQLDKLFHDITNGTLTGEGEWYQSIKAVKDAIPKPEESNGD